MSQADRFLKACRRERADCTPVWLMRQAGPHLPEYQDLLAKHGLMNIMKTPDLALAAHRRTVGKSLEMTVASRYRVGDVLEV